MKKTLIIISSAFLLVACERAQTIGAGARQDAAPYSGTGKPYVESGWKPGDKTSWEAHLRARGQQGQNEYNKTVSR